MREGRDRSKTLVVLTVVLLGGPCGAAASPAGAGDAPAWGALAQAAGDATDAAAITQTASDLRASFAGAASADDLENAAAVYGALVARAQALDLPAAVFEVLAGLAEPLDLRVATRRGDLEEAAGEDEARLESLYRSDRWQKLGASRVEISYWRGWAQLARVQRGLAGEERAAVLADAERAFGRAARALAFPDRALRGLLGLGIARRERGDFEGARQNFERLQEQRAILSDPDLAAVVRYELALTAIDAGDMAHGQDLARALEREGTLTPDQWRALEARRIRAWLTAARRNGGSQRAADSVASAAARLRALLSQGGADAELAGRLIAQFPGELVGADLGPVGALLEADRAFGEEDCERALELYAVALQDDLPRDVDLGQARLRVAYCKVRAGRDDEALTDLDALIEEELSPALRADAARLLQSVAESRLAASADAGSARDLARANRAARVLLEVAPDAAGADVARIRRARELARSGRTDAALDELAAIPSESDAYVAASVERVRLRADRLDRLQRQGGSEKAMRETARSLSRDLDELSARGGKSALPPAPAQEARLAVLRARASLLQRDTPERVDAWIDAARTHPGLDEVGRLALLRVELAVLVDAGRFDAVATLLSARDESLLRAERGVWEEALADLEDVPATASLRVDGYARLERVAPEAARGGLALRRIAALREAGRSTEAVALARTQTEVDPESGDAWLEFARSLDAAGDATASPAAWRRVGGGALPGSESWWEAHLALHDAARARGEPDKACGWLEATRGTPELPAFVERLARARSACP